jgi:Transposase, Mutator family
VQLVISDACRGLVESVADFLPEARYNAAWCISTATSSATSLRPRSVSHILKAIHAQESREGADNKAKAIEDLRASRIRKPADLVEQAVHETLTYLWHPGHSLATDTGGRPRKGQDGGAMTRNELNGPLISSEVWSSDGVRSVNNCLPPALSRDNSCACY